MDSKQCFRYKNVMLSMMGIFAALVLVSVLIIGEAGAQTTASYDSNNNGVIDRSEALQAVMDYFSGTISRQEAINVVASFFSGTVPVPGQTPVPVSSPTPVPVSSPTPVPVPSPTPVPDSIGVEKIVDSKTGATIMLRGNLSAASPGSPPEIIVRNFLDTYASSFNIPRDLQGFNMLPSIPVGDNIDRVRIQQQYNNLPVFDSGMDIDINNKSEVISACSKTAPIGNVNTTPKITLNQASSIVKNIYGLESEVDFPATLGILDTGSLLQMNSEPKLAWQFKIETSEGEQKIFVDAIEGSIAANYNIPASISAENSTCLPTPQYHINPATDVPDFVTFGPTGLWIPESSTGIPEKVALGFFTKYPMFFGTGDVPTQLRIVSIQRETAPPNMTHVVLQQIYGGVPVFGAELRVHLTPAFTISSINGNYLRDPQVLLDPVISEDVARQNAAGKIARTRLDPQETNLIEDDLGIDIENIFKFGISNAKREVILHSHKSLDDRESISNSLQKIENIELEAQPKGLFIFPGKLNKVQTKNDLAYQFQFPEYDIFVSGITGQIIIAIPNYQSANRMIYDALGQSLFSFPEQITQNSNLVSNRPANADVLSADPFILRVLSFYSGVGRTSYDNVNSDVKLVTNGNMTTCPNNALWDGFRNEMWFCSPNAAGQTMVTGDIVGHEFTHGVTQTSAGLLYIDESGALNEHYSDVMGALAFPDSTPGSWIIGDGSGMNRNMSAPANYANYVSRGPGCTGLLDPLTNPLCDFGNVHTNSGIGNRAAVLLSDGLSGSNHNGIGRDRLARLYYDTLTTRMHPWSTYVDEMLNTWETARVFVPNNVRVINSSNTSQQLDFAGVTDEVSWAFTQVGIDKRLTAGWYQVGGGITGNRGTMTFYQGEQMPPGFNVADVELVVRGIVPEEPLPIIAGQAYWEGRSRVSNGGNVVFPGGVFGASIQSHGVGTTNKTVTVRYFHSGFLPFDIQVYIIPGNTTGGGSIILKDRTAHITGNSVHWSDIGLGGRGDDTINIGRSTTGSNCIVDSVDLELMDRNDNVLAATSMGNPDARKEYGCTIFGCPFSYGARITSDNRGTINEAVTVHWWFDIGSAVRYRLKYWLVGTNCGIT